MYGLEISLSVSLFYWKQNKTFLFRVYIVFKIVMNIEETSISDKYA